MVFCVFRLVLSVCFLYGIFCHGALTLDLFALFAIFAFQNLIELNSISCIYLFPLQVVIVAMGVCFFKHTFCFVNGFTEILFILHQKTNLLVLICKFDILSSYFHIISFKAIIQRNCWSTLCVIYT